MRTYLTLTWLTLCIPFLWAQDPGMQASQIAMQQSQIATQAAQQQIGGAAR